MVKHQVRCEKAKASSCKTKDSHIPVASLSERLVARPKSRRKERTSTEDAPRASAAVRQPWDPYKVNILTEDDDNFLSTVARLDQEEEQCHSSTDASPIQHPSQEEVLPKTTTNSKSQVTVQVAPLSESQELWNVAFNSIEKSPEGKELAQKYLKILDNTLGDDNDDARPVDDSDESGTGLTTVLQRDMVQLVRTGLKKVEKASKITKTMGAFAEAVLAAKPLADLVIQTVPHAAPAALPWAGVCAGLQVSSV